MIKKLPIQLIKNGRFIPNKIVEKLLETSSLDMNEIACMDFTNEDREQFAQLIGYSLNGYAELSYVSDESYETVIKMSEGKSDLQSENEYLTETLNMVRNNIKEIAPMLFKIHPDDLVK